MMSDHNSGCVVVDALCSTRGLYERKIKKKREGREEREKERKGKKERKKRKKE